MRVLRYVAVWVPLAKREVTCRLKQGPFLFLGLELPAQPYLKNRDHYGFWVSFRLVTSIHLKSRPKRYPNVIYLPYLVASATVLAICGPGFGLFSSLVQTDTQVPDAPLCVTEKS